ncbi:MAG: hypothetical protein ACLT38_07285 [Akkermansia sp.]
MEGRVSLTGAHADHRLPVSPARLAFFLEELFRYLSSKKNSGQTLPPPRQTDHPLTEKELNWLRHYCG